MSDAARDETAEDAPSVMIVEDDYIIGIHLQQEVRDLGYRVCALTHDGGSALECARRDRPRAALIDVRLRRAGSATDPSDGVGLGARLADELSIPFVLVTAHIDPDTQARARAAGAVRIIEKPFQTRELREALAAVLLESRR